MSALPAETTELSPRPVAVRPAAPACSCGPNGGPSRRWRARSRRRWAVVGVAILGCSFGLTVGVLDVLH